MFSPGDWPAAIDVFPQNPLAIEVAPVAFAERFIPDARQLPDKLQRFVMVRGVVGNVVLPERSAHVHAEMMQDAGPERRTGAIQADDSHPHGFAPWFVKEIKLGSSINC